MGTSSFSHYGHQFQKGVMAALLLDRTWAEQMSEVLEPNHFDLRYLAYLSEKYLNYSKKYKDYPSLKLLITMIKDELKVGSDTQIRDQIVDFIKEVNSGNLAGDLHWIKEQSLEFCKKQTLKRALEKTVDLIATEKYESIVDVIKRAVSAGTSADIGHDFFEDPEARFAAIVRNVVPTGFDKLDAKQIFQGGIGRGELGCVVANTGCHAKGTGILMFDGSIKPVEDVLVGDRLMGPDSKPRNVLSLKRGREMMYEITPLRGSKSFVVNENHILSLRRTKQKKTDDNPIENISVKDYLLKDSKYKHLHKLYRSSVVEFEPSSNIPEIPPYILGILLGDGCLRHQCIEFTTAEPKELLPELREFVKKFDLQLMIHPKEGSRASGYRIVTPRTYGVENRFITLLKKMNLLDKLSGDKFIPHEYKTSSIENRLEILAGLIDTDGHFSRNTFEYSSKSDQLSDDVQFIARSLGLTSTKNPKIVNGTTYYRVHISGDTSIIPVRLKRKQASPRKQIKSNLVSGFSVKKLDVDDYYGFTLDSDHLYLTDEFVVHHNCGKSHFLVSLGANSIRHQYNVIYYTLEMSSAKIGMRFDSNLCDIDSNDIPERKDEVLQFYGAGKFGKLIIKSYPPNTASINTLRSHVEKLSARGFKPDLIIIDYADLMRSQKQYDSPRFELKLIYEDLRTFGDELGVPIWTASQSNREGANSDIIDTNNMAESAGKANTADIVVSISRKANEKASGSGRLYIAKNRAGMDGLVFPLKIDTARSKFEFVGEAQTPEEFKHEIETDAKQILRDKFAKFEDMGLKKVS